MLRELRYNMPYIKRMRDPYWIQQGVKWIVVSKHHRDFLNSFSMAIRYWLWNCGISPKICFRKYGRS